MNTWPDSATSLLSLAQAYTFTRQPNPIWAPLAGTLRAQSALMGRLESFQFIPSNAVNHSRFEE